MIQKVELKEIELEEVLDENGDLADFKEVVKRKEIVPAKITNYGLKRGTDEGLLKGNVLTGILGMKKLMDSKASNEDVVGSLSETELQKVIYLGVIGANPQKSISFDEFVRLYHGDTSETMRLYVGLIEDMYKNSSAKNAFAEGLSKSTKKEKKPQKRQKSTSNA